MFGFFKKKKYPETLGSAQSEFMEEPSHRRVVGKANVKEALSKLDRPKGRREQKVANTRLATSLYRNGKTVIQIAETIGVSRVTVYSYLNGLTPKHPKKGKRNA